MKKSSLTVITLLIICLAVIATGGIVLRTQQSSWKNAPLIDFSHLSLPQKENFVLVYQDEKPPRLLKAPVFNVRAQALESCWLQFAKQQKNLHLLKQAGQHFQYVSYSRWFRFPDVIDLSIVSLTPQTSTLYIYSRSVYGYYDFKVNIKRVTQWLAAMTQAAC